MWYHLEKKFKYRYIQYLIFLLYVGRSEKKEEFGWIKGYISFDLLNLSNRKVYLRLCQSNISDGDFNHIFTKTSLMEILTIFLQKQTRSSMFDSNLVQKIAEKITKLSKLIFSMGCFKAKFGDFLTKMLKVTFWVADWILPVIRPLLR